jgi:hypothetical protein
MEMSRRHAVRDMRHEACGTRYAVGIGKKGLGLGPREVLGLGEGLGFGEGLGLGEGLRLEKGLELGVGLGLGLGEEEACPPSPRLQRVA